MQTILIISGISLVAALVLIKYVNHKSKKREIKPDLTIKIPIKTTYSKMEYLLASIINNHREDNLGFKRLKLNDTISTVCKEHSLNLAKLTAFKHEKAYLRTLKLRKAIGIKHTSEVVAKRQGTAQGMLKMLLKSPAHKEAIEDPTWTKFGLSIEPSILRRNYMTCIFTK